MGQTRYPSKSFKSHFSFKVRQHGQQNLYLQYKVYWILYKMVGTSSFSQPYLCMQSLLRSPPQIQCSTSVNFHLPIPPLFVHKIILTIPTNTHFLSTSSIFHLPIFAYNIPTIYTKTFFFPQSLIQFRLHQATTELVILVRNDTVLISLLPQSMDNDNRAHNHWSLIAQAQKVGVL